MSDQTKAKQDHQIMRERLLNYTVKDELKDYVSKESTLTKFREDLRMLNKLDMHGDEINQYIKICALTIRLGQILSEKTAIDEDV